MNRSSRRALAVAAWLLALSLLTLADSQLVRAAASTAPGHRTRELLAVFKGLGSLPVWALVAAGLVLADRAALGRMGRRALERACTLLTAATAAGVAAEALKMLIRRRRPDAGLDLYSFRPYLDRPFYGGGIGMPSSHAAVAFAGLFVLMRLFPTARPLWWLLGLGLAWQRVVERAHFPSDVFVGATVGWLAVAGAWWLHGRIGSGLPLEASRAAAPGTRVAAPPAPRTVGFATALEGRSAAAATPAWDAPRLSVVVPAHDEAASLGRLVGEFGQHVIGAGIDAELLVVDDGSADGSWPLLAGLAAERPWLRPLRLAGNHGQSVAMGVGVEHARGAAIATLDADLQNDPADLPKLLGALESGGVDFVQGHRVDRRDTAAKRLASRIGRLARRLVLADPVQDTGCSIRVVRAAYAKRWPLHLRGMHRFLPAYSAMEGARIVEVPVRHRRRVAGVSHYGSLRRGFAGLVDLLAVRWMLSRHQNRPDVLAPQPAAVRPVGAVA